MSRWQVRLAVNAMILLLIAVLFAGYVWYDHEQQTRAGRIDNCVAINELSRKIYITLADAGLPEYQVRKFRPSLHCEEIP